MQSGNLYDLSYDPYALDYSSDDLNSVYDLQYDASGNLYDESYDPYALDYSSDETSNSYAYNDGTYNDGTYNEGTYDDGTYNDGTDYYDYNQYYDQSGSTASSEESISNPNYYDDTGVPLDDSGYGEIIDDAYVRRDDYSSYDLDSYDYDIFSDYDIYEEGDFTNKAIYDDDSIAKLDPIAIGNMYKNLDSVPGIPKSITIPPLMKKQVAILETPVVSLPPKVIFTPVPLVARLTTGVEEVKSLVSRQK